MLPLFQAFVESSRHSRVIQTIENEGCVSECKHLLGARREENREFLCLMERSYSSSQILGIREDYNRSIITAANLVIGYHCRGRKVDRTKVDLHTSFMSKSANRWVDVVSRPISVVQLYIPIHIIVQNRRFKICKYSRGCPWGNSSKRVTGASHTIIFHVTLSAQQSHFSFN